MVLESTFELEFPVYGTFFILTVPELMPCHLMSQLTVSSSFDASPSLPLHCLSHHSDGMLRAFISVGINACLFFSLLIKLSPKRVGTLSVLFITILYAWNTVHSRLIVKFDFAVNTYRHICIQNSSW